MDAISEGFGMSLPTSQKANGALKLSEAALIMVPLNIAIPAVDCLTAPEQRQLDTKLFGYIWTRSLFSLQAVRIKQRARSPFPSCSRTSRKHPGRSVRVWSRTPENGSHSFHDVRQLCIFSFIQSPITNYSSHREAYTNHNSPTETASQDEIFCRLILQFSK